MMLSMQFRLAVMSAAVLLASACALKPRPVAFEPAAPLELERGSYGESQRDKYNRIFSQPQSERPAPNVFLVECLQRIAAQRQREKVERATSNSNTKARITSPAPVATTDDSLTALDAGMGDGRNTIALAQYGYHTVGFDMADVGVNRARKRAAELGLTIDAQVDLYAEKYLQEKSWDVLALMYFGFSPYDGQENRERVKNSVKPGGYIIYEVPGGHLQNDLLRVFMDWEIIVYEMDWGVRQWESGRPVDNPGQRTRLLVRRPRDSK